LNNLVWLDNSDAVVQAKCRECRAAFLASSPDQKKPAVLRRAGFLIRNIGGSDLDQRTS
jgi:hypothetical protein